MNKETFKYILLIAAIGLVLAGLILTVRTLRQISDADKKINVRIAQIETVKNLSSEISEYNAALKLYESLDECRLRPVSVTVKESFPDFRADTIKDFRRETMSGWVFYEKEITFGDVDISTVVGLLEKLELQRPPWRLVKCLIKSSSRQAGNGRVIVTLEGIERE